mgnify:FL=1
MEQAPKVEGTSSGTSALSAGLGGGCARVALVVAIHDLASHFENALYAFRDDAEALLKAKRDIAWARRTAAQYNYNGAGCKEPPNVELRGGPAVSSPERPA